MRQQTEQDLDRFITACKGSDPLETWTAMVQQYPVIPQEDQRIVIAQRLFDNLEEFEVSELVQKLRSHRSAIAAGLER